MDDLNRGLCLNINKDYLTKLVINGPDTYPGAKILERKNGDNISLRYVDRNSLILENGDLFIVFRTPVDFWNLQKLNH